MLYTLKGVQGKKKHKVGTAFYTGRLKIFKIYGLSNKGQLFSGRNPLAPISSSPSR